VSFRAVLQREFDQRRARNPRYSLRAFARALRVDHSALSQILRGRRRLTPRVIRRLGARLEVPTLDLELHCADENERALAAVLAHPAFRPDSRWLAKLLGIPIDDVNIALQRLVRAGALVMGGHEWVLR
jgi:transcriptional regulator with XRE-family HTH domain